VPAIRIRFATEQDVPLILQFIRDLAEYERLSHELIATEDLLRTSLFGPQPGPEVIFAEVDGIPAGFALFFHNYSTFLAQRGLYLEDLFVRPEFRGHGIGRRLLTYLAHLAVTRGCGRFEWWVLDWNETAIGFYKRLGAVPMSDWTVFRVTGEALALLAAEHGHDNEEGEVHE
jgi:GNAT superfamily N-acetyltransferase